MKSLPILRSVISRCKTLIPETPSMLIIHHESFILSFYELRVEEVKFGTVAFVLNV